MSTGIHPLSLPGPRGPAATKPSASVRARRVLLPMAALSLLFATAARAQSLAAVTLPPVWLGGHSARLLPLDIAIGLGGGVIIGRKNDVGMVVVDGQAVALRGKAGYTNVQPSAVSRNGLIVGTAAMGAQVRGLFWPSHASEPIDMGALVAITIPRGVNSSGVAVGDMVQPLPGGQEIRTAFAWSLATGLRPIGPPGSSFSTAHAISDSGYAAGEAAFAGDLAAMRWFPGTTQTGVAEFGTAALHVKENGTIYNQFRSWNLLNRATTIAPTVNDVVAGISEPGRVVGTRLGTVQMPFRRAWTLGFGTSLTNLPLPAGATDTFAAKVDDCGSVLGGAVLANGTSQAVYWAISACDPTPTRR